ncbi:hypothetical protein HanRHA438_Chr14g0668511 [Helianthus annuus]|nr:hypothetical protein HanRHA438_Chr14g0668511 [Helianthus annuus]
MLSLNNGTRTKFNQYMCSFTCADVYMSVCVLCGVINSTYTLAPMVTFLCMLTCTSHVNGCTQKLKGIDSLVPKPMLLDIIDLWTSRTLIGPT